MKQVILLMFHLFVVEAVVHFSASPKSVEYVREGQTVSLKWEYTIEASDKLVGIIWMSYDPPGFISQSSEFRLAVKSADGVVGYFPNKPKGENLYQGRIRINVKDQATLEITNVTLDNIYYCAVNYKRSSSTTIFSEVSERVKVIPTGRYP